MNRRTYLGFAMVPLGMAIAGCTSDDADGEDGGLGDRFPDRVELDVTASIDAEHDLGVSVELEDTVLTRSRPRESLWLNVSNADDEPITAADNSGLFPPEIELGVDNDIVSILLERDDENVDTIHAGESSPIIYKYSLSNWHLNRLFEGTEPIEYIYDGSAAVASVTISFYSESTYVNGETVQETAQ